MLPLANNHFLKSTYFPFIQFRLHHVCVSMNAIPYHLLPSYTLEEKEDSFMNLKDIGFEITLRMFKISVYQLHITLNE